MRNAYRRGHPTLASGVLLLLAFLTFPGPGAAISDQPDGTFAQEGESAVAEDAILYADEVSCHRS